MVILFTMWIKILKIKELLKMKKIAVINILEVSEKTLNTAT